MKNEVLDAKEFLRKHFETTNPWSGEVVQNDNGENLLKDAQEANIEPTELEAGIGLDVANWLVDRRRRRRYNKNKDKLPRIVAQGDSWFLHPLVPDAIDHMSEKYAIRSLAAAGAEFSGMLEAREKIESALDETGATILLLSGGGNDLLGDRFGEWIHHIGDVTSGAEAHHYLNEAYQKTMNYLIDSYGRFLSELAGENKDLTIYVHGYDYVIPRYGNGSKGGKWLGKALFDKGFYSEKEHDRIRRGIVKAVVDQFNEALKKMTNDPVFSGRICYVNHRNIVKKWYDEIHPDGVNTGYVAKNFIAAID